MYIQTQNRSYVRRHVRALVAASFLSSLFMLLVIGPSWAIEAIKIDPSPAALSAAETSPLTSTEPSVTDDPCRSLLNDIKHSSPASVTNGRRHEAGQAAAVGLILGFRFALGPKEVSGSNRSSVGLNVWRPQDTGLQALAVSDYRRCKNEHALSALRELRWSR